MLKIDLQFLKIKTFKNHYNINTKARIPNKKKKNVKNSTDEYHFLLFYRRVLYSYLEIVLDTRKMYYAVRLWFVNM